MRDRGHRRRSNSRTELLERMAACMAHRGPDGQRTWADAHAGLAFRRLAVIDLDERSMQPMHLGRWHLVLNGEIYNYRELRAELATLGHAFLTEGDGEVLLHAWAEWEEGALGRLDGMFAFAIWDNERRELTCASDPFGEKPLYWAQDGARLVFASDIRALLEARPGLGAPRLESLGSVLGPRRDAPDRPELLRRGEPAAGSASAAPARRSRSGGGLLASSPRRGPSRYEEAAERLASCCWSRSGGACAPTSPSGRLERGGGLLGCGRAPASLAGDHRHHAFTARFPGFSRDEWRYAHDVAHRSRGGRAPRGRTYGRRATRRPRRGRVRAGRAVRLFEHLRAVVSMRAARSSGVTVLLDGQGADEIFGGYPGSNGWALRSMGPFAMLRGLVSRRDRADVVKAFGSERLPRRVARSHRRTQVTPYATREVADEAARATPPSRADAGGLRGRSHASSCGRASTRVCPSSFAMPIATRWPTAARSPAVPEQGCGGVRLLSSGVVRLLLRREEGRIARGGARSRARQVLKRTDKVGFETPQATWLSEPTWVARIGELLLDQSVRARGLVDVRAVESDLSARRWRDPDGIWRAVNLVVWLRAFERVAEPRVRAESVVR